MSKIGRNEPCPSGSEAKFKKCLRRHPELSPSCSVGNVWWVCSRWQADEPDFDELFESWLQSTNPIPDKTDDFLKQVFEQPVESVNWRSLFQHGQKLELSDLPELYRRISAVLVDGQSQMCGQFQSTAAEVLSKDHSEMFDEVLTNTMALDPATPMNELKAIVQWAVDRDQAGSCEPLQKRFAAFPDFLLARSKEEEWFDEDDTDTEEEESEFPPEVEEQLDKAWSNYNAIEKPTPDDAEALMEALLQLPHEATSWIEPFDTLRASKHPDLFSLLSRIVSALGSVGGSDVSFMVWGAMEEASSRGEIERLPEISEYLCRGDAASLDTDAVFHVGEYLLAHNFVDECLALKEYHYPTLIDNDAVLSWVAPHAAGEIFTIRLGRMISSSGFDERGVSEILAELSDGLEDEVDSELNERLIQRLLEGGDDFEVEEELEMPLSGTPTEQAQTSWVAVHAAFVQVAKHASETTDEHPAKILVGLQVIEDSARKWIATRRKKNKKHSRNLFDCIDPRYIEQQVAGECRGMMGTNEEKARTMLAAYSALVHWAVHHGIPLPADSSKIVQKLSDLQKKIGMLG